MEPWLVAMLQVAPFVLLLLGTYGIGSAVERRHFRMLRARELRSRNLPVATLREPLPGWQVEECALVTGSCVISLDYFKRFVAGLRKLDLTKAPSIAETLDWARGLCALGIHELDAAAVRQTLALVCKHEDDLRKAESKVGALLAAPARG